MAPQSADKVAAALIPGFPGGGTVNDWAAAAEYLKKREPSGWIYVTVVEKRGTLPREYTRHRDAEAAKQRLALERSEVDARRAMPPPPATPERPPMAPGATRAGLPAELQRRWAQKAVSE